MNDDANDAWLSEIATVVDSKTFELIQDHPLNSVSTTAFLSSPETPNRMVKKEQNAKRSRKQDLRSTLRKQLHEKVPLYEMDPKDPSLNPSEKKKIEKAIKSRDYRVSKLNSHREKDILIKQLQLDNAKLRKENQLLKARRQQQLIPVDLEGPNMNSDEIFEEDELMMTKFSDVCEHQNDQKL